MTGGFSALGDTDDTAASDVHFKGHARVRGPGWAKFPLITIGLLGVQIFWSVEMSYASPYLLSLGLSKSYMALVFVAGPLSGLIVQPLIGLLADTSKSRFGRRRPYIVLGGAICIFAMLLLGFTNVPASWFTSEGSDANKALTIWLAVLAIYCIDFAINAVQAMDRALLIDTLRTSQQPSGNAWAARMLGIGSVLGFAFGAIDLERWFSFLGNTELQILSVIACFSFFVTQMMTVAGTEEKVLVSSNKASRTFVQEMKDMITNIKTLPRDIQQICFVQFFAWIGWFPFIFYTTTYIGYLHESSSPIYNSLQSSAEELAEVAEEGVRLGTRAMLCNAILSLISNIVLPYFVDGNSEDDPATSGGRGESRRSRMMPRPWWKINLASLWALSHLVFACCMGATLFVSSVGGTTFLVTMSGFSWAVTQWAPFALLAEAILTSSSKTSDNRNSIMLNDTRTRRSGDEEHAGLLTSEAPSDSLEQTDAPSPSREEQRHKPRRRSSAGSGDGSDASDSDEENGRTEVRGHDRQRSLSVMGNLDAQLSVLDVHTPDANDLENGRSGTSEGQKKGLSAKAGIILGIHNTSIVIPQFIISGLSSIIFALSSPPTPLAHRDPGEATNGTTVDSPIEVRSREPVAESASSARAVGFILRIGAVSAIIAFVLCWRLAREMKRR